MRTICWTLVLAVGCGGGGDSNTKRDASANRDTMTMPTADAPPLLACTPRSGNTISLRELPAPGGAAMLATAPKNDGRLFVVLRDGRIRIYENEQLKTEVFLDVSDDPGFASGGEQGLLGLAFHPNYAANRQFFVYYTTNNANVVKRYFASETNYNRADPAGEVIVSIPDFAGNHNGGMIEFGSDGYLYIGTGDGGGGGDPCRTGQQLLRNGDMCPGQSGTTREPLLGKILRIDVDNPSGSKKYGIPSSNPFAGGGGEPEIYIIGLRNPWRWSFDRATGDMYIGDVGQDTDEELTVLTPAQQNGANLGWSMYEGTREFRGGANPTGVTMPQFTRSQPGVGANDGWESIIGGAVYRGTCFPDLVGDHFFTDYAKRQLLRGRFAAGAYTANVQPLTMPSEPASIYNDARGELFLTTVGGKVFQIEAGP